MTGFIHILTVCLALWIGAAAGLVLITLAALASFKIVAWSGRKSAKRAEHWIDRLGEKAVAAVEARAKEDAKKKALEN